ncbi:2',3'-cyclic-nucleotide 2'-phosphodiesterase/3'-nucleotidase [Kribbella orskensis]|uniref:2',3'-cyclic-nucleotide 2'-phosphodiesterase/3'-nucleotidase n=1 Tax=Kribbella orskensis TaxID=2512216 RepID=A0ABY2BWI2_9ACTN|nr:MULTISPECIES: 5'-nucleotidase C-terminal domain-containing protein [Kribbella]TCN44519.1 2',3'-cyclic-nucleotide 2'-phosphodiesterase/3'-nucleotidase [Kribbella sp. VKM Ac-2500]TCO31703.1 2',3'-cyclic-nucleotide 2'-phosphodiesterase/3'-nucleotidase [Kribbella orskensis]
MTDSRSEDQAVDRSMGRRTVIGGAAATALAAAGFQAVPAYAGGSQGGGSNGRTVRLSVMGTTDLHGNVFNWDYFKNTEYDDTAHNDIGLAKVSTLVKAVRARIAKERRTPAPLMLDAGDTIQGTPLAYYFAKIEPITGGHVHPMAAAMNEIGYDAAALGNHEFNYGLDILRKFQRQLRFPLLGANAQDWTTGLPVFPPYVLKRVHVPGEKPITVGILGLTNPGIAIWDKANVENKVKFGGIVELAKIWVPRVRKAGADVVIVSAHSGMDLSSSYGDALPVPENASALMAEEVPGIDAVLVGHAHLEIPQRLVTNKATGESVVLVEPLKWGMRLALIDLDLQKVSGQWKVVGRHSQVLNANTVAADPQVTKLLQKDHDKVVEYVNSKIGTCTEAMSAATAPWEDTAALDFVNFVQADAVSKALAGTPEAALPVLAIAAPFNRAAAIPAGDVSVRDVAGLYIFDNTLLAVTMTGAQVKDYLEFSAQYFKQVSGPGPFTPDQVTNAPTPTAPGGTPDYNYDILGGLAKPLAYKIDIAKAVGARISDLTYGGEAVTADQQFVVAVNNYRQSGGGNFPHVKTAPVLYNRQVEIRQLMIDYVTTTGEVNPNTFHTTDWSLTANGAPVVITP